MNNPLLFIVLLVAILPACSDTTDKPSVLSSASLLPYDFSHPSQVYSLPSSLDEISGMAYLGQNRVACVQDEEGIIYIYNLALGKIEHELRFGKGGDYEDLVRAGDTYFVLRSDGKIFQVGQNGETITYKTSIDNSCNAESLCYDSAARRLLIACKNNDKEVWAFGLDEKKLLPGPLFKIKRKGFHPTAMALEKPEGPLYILSNEEILVSDQQGVIRESFDLTSPLFRQAEGITFKENGDLLISNEAKGSDATILEFKNRKNQM